jgi:short-subunit dehydrogenase
MRHQYVAGVSRCDIIRGSTSISARNLAWFTLGRSIDGSISTSNGGGALLNVLSIVSWVNAGQLAAYAASKSAAWSLTNSLRHELAAQKTQVLALHMSFVDTDLARAIDSPKTSREDVVKRALDGLESGLDEVLADERTKLTKQGLTASRPSYLPQKG